MGSLISPSALRTQMEGETLDLLLSTHFPGSISVEGEAVSATASRTNRLDWQVAARVVTYKKSGVGN
jgi:hypothetical protein